MTDYSDDIARAFASLTRAPDTDRAAIDVHNADVTLRDAQIRLLGSYKTLLKSIDVTNGANWRLVIAVAMRSGVTEREFLDTISAGHISLNKWLREGGKPRASSRFHIRQALCDLLDQKVEDIKNPPNPRLDAERAAAKVARLRSTIRLISPDKLPVQPE